MSIERRTVLKTAAAATAAGPFAGFVTGPALAQQPPQPVTLVPVPDLRDDVVRLHLPAGFKYRSFHDTDTPPEAPVTLTDGTVLPGRHDGMGAFRGPRGSIVLVRNHELNNPPQGQPPGTAFGPREPYDERALGGTTTIQVTGRGHEIRSFTSLNGTMMNCSGGVMPWGSWITCEETVNGPDVGPDFTGASNAPLQQPHGYIFEVPARAHPGDGKARKPIRSAGRFAHEAVSFDPKGGHLYLTEDNFGFPSGFYRYKPPVHPMKVGRLKDGGKLQMLKVKGVDGARLEGTLPDGATYDVEWVTIDEPDFLFDYTPGTEATTPNDTAINFVAQQGLDKGAAMFSRLEGQVYDRGVVYFTSTQGGGPSEPGLSDTVQGWGNGFGQVWAYHTRTKRLRLVFQSPGQMVLDFPDNVTTSKRGTLVVCEDSSGDNYLRGLSRRGHLWDIALNRLVSSSGASRFGDEFAGSTFSPSGRTLFVNIQASRGMSFAIWGPWGSIGV